MNKKRLDQALQDAGLTETRSQAENYIKLGYVSVDGQAVTKPGHMVYADAKLKLNLKERYVSRAAYKLASVAKALKLSFKGKIVLDVGSSTGGFTDYALQHGAKKVIAVDVGTDQLHPRLRSDKRVVLYEQTDVRDLRGMSEGDVPLAIPVPDIVVVDVSFISLKGVLPHVALLSGQGTEIVAMVKPQFEASAGDQKHKGVIKNERLRRDVLKDFESWAASRFVIAGKADSAIKGAKGNTERFYTLRLKPGAGLRT